MKIEILEASYHRNGIAGIGFYAVLFNDLEQNHNPMIASIFEEEEHGYCAVYSVPELSKGNIAFAQGNSWRGDRYESAIRKKLDKFIEENGTNQIGPFAMPDVPHVAQETKEG